jgi:hypothetical protein
MQNQEQIFQQCELRRLRARLDQKGYSKVWRSLNEYCTEQLGLGKGVTIPQFFTVRHELDSRGTPINVVFDFTDQFLALHRLSIKPATQLMTLAPANPINVAAIALESKMERATVQNALADIAQQAGMMLGQGVALELEFSFGIIQANHSKFVFLPPPESYRADEQNGSITARRAHSRRSSRHSSKLPSVRSDRSRRSASIASHRTTQRSEHDSRRPSTSQVVA